MPNQPAETAMMPATAPTATVTVAPRRRAAAGQNAGDRLTPADIGQLYTSHRRLVANVILQYPAYANSSRRDVQDGIQDVAVRALAGVVSAHVDTDTGAGWLRSVAHSTALNTHAADRAQARDIRLEDSLDAEFSASDADGSGSDLTLADRIADASADPLQQLMMSRFWAALARAAAALGTGIQGHIAACGDVESAILDPLTLAEIAPVYGVSVATAHRHRVQLRALAHALAAEHLD